MKIYVQPLRKDGKHKVVYSFDNGVIIRKILTHAETLEAMKKADYVHYHALVR